MATTPFYAQVAVLRGDDSPLRQCVASTVRKLLIEDTSTHRPGVLLGRIQSGKTRAFLGVIAEAFDNGYEIAVILTKGTVSLARQTLNRVRSDFRSFIDEDEIQVYDIMTLPDLTPYELNQRLILVVKKEADNLRRLLDAFREKYPQLRSRKTLIVDDEADLATVSFRRSNGEASPGVISSRIEELRCLVTSLSFLQVTATPYSLYLQPEEEVRRNGAALFQPKRPAFTELLPKHPHYVGGEYYFEESSDPTSTAYYVYEEVPLPERDILKESDRRKLKLENVLQEKGVAVLRRALVNFVLGAGIRRLQERAAGRKPQKYAFLFHTEFARGSHAWQEEVASEIRAQLVEAARSCDPLLDTLLQASYQDLEPSIRAGGETLPSIDECSRAVREALTMGFMMITRVNSDKDVEQLLDDRGQLKLRNPMNVFIGGQILDRGLTIDNLIGFYYGRNPQRFQQDTVLQHSRMYGARPKSDLAVTRFYSPLHIYQLLRKIHEFDTALRDAFLKAAHDNGVYFIQRDIADRLIPCSPNKLMFSKITSVRPGNRLLPVNFQTVARSVGNRNLDQLDKMIRALIGNDGDGNTMIAVETTVKLIELAYQNLEFSNSDDDERKAHIALIEHLSKSSEDICTQGKVQLIVARNRDNQRIRPGGRFTDNPDTKQQQAARDQAETAPALLMLRENGSQEQGWRGLPFWWPIVVVPKRAVASVFAAESPIDDVTIALGQSVA